MSLRSAMIVVVVATGAGACGKRGSPPPAPPAPPAVVVQPGAETAAPTPAAAASEKDEISAWIRSHYTKFEYRIPMRDGIHLFTTVLVPIDAGPDRRYPFLLLRTPYSVAPYGTSRYPGYDRFYSVIKDGYILVSQDVRGRHMSEGTFVDMRPILPAGHGSKDTDEATDTYDSIDWLIHHVDHGNGKVALWGQSYPGFYAAAGSIDSHPALVASVPQAPIDDWWIGDDMHRNGALCLQEVFTFFAGFGRTRPAPTDAEHDWPTHDFGTPDAYQFFLDLGGLSELGADDFGADIPYWADLKAHPDYDAWWQDRVLRPRLTHVRAATMVVGGFYDTEDLYGTIEVYHGIEEHNPGTTNTLVMGPWKHGGWHDATNQHLGDADFGYRTDQQFEALLLAFLRHHLKGGPDPRLPEAYVFESGANRWRSFAQWPPKEVRDQIYWLAADGALATTAPATTDGFDQFISDPAHPVPYTAEPQTKKWDAGYMAEDQRFASRRPDVVTYQTPPLDRDVTLAGPIEVELAVSTTGTDADWVVKLVDAWPGRVPGWTTADTDAGKPDLGGRQILVRGEPFRGRYRDGLATPKPFVPGEVATVKFTLDDVMHTFQRGHRIMIQVQSSWFPFIDRNPQTFVPTIYEAVRSDFKLATHRVHRGSKITVKVLPAADEPPTPTP